MSASADNDEPDGSEHSKGQAAGHVDPVEVIEVVTGEVDSDGNVIVDDAVFVVDAGGTVVAKDETITFESPEGYTIVSELGPDGEMHLIDPAVHVSDADEPSG